MPESVELALLVAAAAIFLGGLWLHDLLDREASRWLAAGLGKASREHGIRFAPSRHRRTAHGQCGDFSVGVELRREDTQTSEGKYGAEEYLLVTLAGPRIPRGLRFSAERGSGEDVLTRDPCFDDAVEVLGEPSIVLALFDAALRRRVGEFVALGGRLSEGTLVWRSHAAFSDDEIPHSLRVLLNLARDLCSSEAGGLCERLARNAGSDPHPNVRWWNLLQLQEEFAETQEAREASRAGLTDSSPWVRLSAARFLRDEGLEVLEALTQDRRVPEHAAAEAVALVAAQSAVEHAGPLLVTLLKTRTGEVRRQAVEELGRLKHRAALGPLIVLLEHADPRTAAVAAAALGALGDDKAEPSLLKTVESDDRELRLAAARALGAVGGVRSVEPLMSCLGSRRLDSEIRQGLRDAIGAIQSRLAGAEAGQLSITTSAPESGRLSLATRSAAAGDLSLVPDKAGERT